MRVQELRLWALCVRLMRFTQYDNPADVARAWDLLLKDAVDGCGDTAVAARLRAACTEAESLAQDTAGTAWCAWPGGICRVLLCERARHCGFTRRQEQSKAVKSGATWHPHRHSYSINASAPTPHTPPHAAEPAPSPKTVRSTRRTWPLLARARGHPPATACRCVCLRISLVDFERGQASAQSDGMHCKQLHTGLVQQAALAPH